MKIKVDSKKRIRLVLTEGLLTLLLLLYSAVRVDAFDFQGRIDTRYELQTGDNATDHDLYQYHFIDLFLLKNLTFQWYGAARKDFGGKKDEITSGGEERTDISFRGLPDAANTYQTLEYRIFTAYLKYNTDRFGALIGRNNLYEYEFSQFDGIMLWGLPIDWLRVEGFGGKPWHYNYINNLQYYWGAGEFIGGASVDFLFSNKKLDVSLRYLYLREKTQKNTLIGEAADTYLADDHILTARAGYIVSDWMRTSFTTSFLNTTPRNMHIWLNGSIDRYLTTYSIEYYMQLIDISDLGDSLTQFSSSLTSSHPYLRAAASLSKNFTNIFNLRGLLDDAELELGYEHRQPADSGDESQFNPHYDMFHIGSILSTGDNWYLQVFYEFILTTGVENDIHTVGGDIAKKWDKLKLQLGSSYYVNKFETNYSNTIIEDSFFAQEYYFKLKWLPIKSIDVSFKTSFETAELTSLTNAEKINEGVVSSPATELISDPRKYLKFDIRTGYHF